MRKLLSSKKYSPTCGCTEVDVQKVGRSRKPNKQTRKQPKQTLLPNWSIRNDSSNVSAILHPNDYLESPRTYSHCKESNLLEDKHKGVFKKCCLARNTCYCKGQKIKPTLLSRPNTCPSVDEVACRLLGDDLYRTCLCKDDVSSYTDVGLLRRYKEDLDRRCSCLKYSQQRSDYEAFRHHKEHEHRQKQKEYETTESVATILGTKTVDTQTVSTDLDELSKFRKDHYFETHSTDDLEQETPEHTCVHEYKLDDRLLPEPTNVDSYGRSRCTICKSPQEGSLPSTGTCRNVCICDDDSKVELKLDKRDLERFGGFVGRFRRPEHFNTLALRQQKMLRHKKRIDNNASAEIYY